MSGRKNASEGGALVASQIAGMKVSAETAEIIAVQVKVQAVKINIMCGLDLSETEEDRCRRAFAEVESVLGSLLRERIMMSLVGEGKGEI